MDLEREVSMIEGIELAMHCNCPFIESSAKFRFHFIVDIIFDITLTFSYISITSRDPKLELINKIFEIAPTFSSKVIAKTKKLQKNSK